MIFHYYSFVSLMSARPQVSRQQTADLRAALTAAELQMEARRYSKISRRYQLPEVSELSEYSTPTT